LSEDKIYNIYNVQKPLKLFGRSVGAGSLGQTHKPKIALVQFPPKKPPK
jgi:hypothetical protein